jgi:adenine deaminase
MIEGQILTRACYEEVPSSGGWVHSNTESDILKLAVVERHTRSGRVGLGLVRGFGLKQGALASSVAHDSHNVIAVGVKDEEICKAVEEVGHMGGGMAAVCEDRALARVSLKVAGLMTDETLELLVPRLLELKEAVAGLGCSLEEPFMALSFLALPVIPELKLTDRGLVDVNRFEIVPLFVGSS